ncbi:MAG: hypothetical protein JO311_04090 [Candidatus Eremiobacteraeota bacterium]|nr:hypothetical protein [Candidatus Eremiobacteraeota bacterium]
MILGSPPNVDAQSIWLRTRSAVSGAQYPRRIDYTIALSGLDGSVLKVDHYGASCDPNGPIRVFAMSDEGLAAPPQVPHGVNVFVTFSVSEGRGAPASVALPIGHAAPSADLLGEPVLSPTYMFGLDYPVRNNHAPIEASSLKTIAVVAAASPEYRVTLIDVPVVDGMPAYHLELTPLRRPKENRLRELWVRTDDYLPLQAIVAGNFTAAPLVDVPWLVNFTTIDGAPYISRESAMSSLYLAHRRIVRNAVIAFENIRQWDGSIYGKPLVSPETDDNSLTEPNNK